MGADARQRSGRTVPRPAGFRWWLSGGHALEATSAEAGGTTTGPEPTIRPAGGHIEPGEHPTTPRRELAEELGIHRGPHSTHGHRVLGLTLCRPSSSRFVPPDEGERLADAFFAEPDASVRCWELAVDAQARIVTGLADLLDPEAGGDITVVGHGPVGALWHCHLTGAPINRPDP